MTISFVQNAFYDTFGARYPGQITEYGSLANSMDLRGYVVESGIHGYGVVKGAAAVQNDPITVPYNVKAPVSGSVLADFVGILIRTDASNTDANNNSIPVRYPTMGPVAELGSKVIVGATVPAGITIAHGDPVYMSVSHASIPVGAFSNAAATGLIAITGATWYGVAAAGTVGRIKL